MSDFESKMLHNRFRLGLCLAPLGELKALPSPLTGIKGTYTSKGRGGVQKGAERIGKTGDPLSIQATANDLGFQELAAALMTVVALRRRR